MAVDEAEADAAAAPDAERTSARQWYLVGVISTVAALNYVDRGGINLLINPIKADLGASDVEMSLLVGFSFIVLYTLLSIPAGYLADIFSRRLMIGGAVFFWSCMEMLCGFSSTFRQLFSGRVGLGLGEAVLPPAAYSLLRDGVAPSSRGRAFSIYLAAGHTGGGLGILIGGALYGLAVSGALHGIPVIGHLKPWQVVLAVPGMVGLPLSLLLLTIREPVRRKPAQPEPTPTYRELLRYLRVHWRLYGPILGAITVQTFAFNGWSGWMAAAIGRAWDLSPAEIGKTMGLMTITIGPINVIFTGWLMDRCSRGNRPERAIYVPIILCILTMIPSLAIFHMPSVRLMWIAYAISLFVVSSNLIATSAPMATVTPSRYMGKITAFYFLLSNLLGNAIGTTVVALISKYFFTGKLAIIGAMQVFYPTFMVVNLMLLFALVRQIRLWRERQSAGV